MYLHIHILFFNKGEKAKIESKKLNPELRYSTREGISCGLSLGKGPEAENSINWIRILLWLKHKMANFISQLV